MGCIHSYRTLHRRREGGEEMGGEGRRGEERGGEGRRGEERRGEGRGGEGRGGEERGGGGRGRSALLFQCQCTDLV